MAVHTATLNKCDLLLFPLKRKRQHGLGFEMFHLNKPRDFWNTVLGTEGTKVEMFGHNNTVYQHSGGGLMIWA